MVINRMNLLALILCGIVVASNAMENRADRLQVPQRPSSKKVFLTGLVVAAVVVPIRIMAEQFLTEQVGIEKGLSRVLVEPLQTATVMTIVSRMLRAEESRAKQE